MSQIETPLYDVHMKGCRSLCLCKILIVLGPNTLRTVRMSLCTRLRLHRQKEGKFLRELVDLARMLRLNTQLKSYRASSVLQWSGLRWKIYREWSEKNTEL
jgi:hypothetical protein